MIQILLVAFDRSVIANPLTCNLFSLNKMNSEVACIGRRLRVLYEY